MSCDYQFRAVKVSWWFVTTIAVCRCTFPPQSPPISFRIKSGKLNLRGGCGGGVADLILRFHLPVVTGSQNFTLRKNIALL